MIFTTTSNPTLAAERRRALRALLRNPLLSATGETAEEYLLVRRHSEWLKHWLGEFPGWSLHTDKDVVRLGKLPSDLLDETRPARDRSSGTAFTRRRYAVLCLALAALERLEWQTTLREIAQTIMELVAADRDLQAVGLVFDIGNYDQRRDLVHAVRLLMDTGVLRRLDGDEQRFLNRDDSSDVLYDIHRSILAAMLHVPGSASAVEAAAQEFMGDSIRERAARLTDFPKGDTPEESSHRIRFRLVRALLDDPVLYSHDLNDEERSYLEKHRGSLLRQISEATGLVAEVRREGIALVDDSGNLTDLKLEEEGPGGCLILLLVQWFVECLRNAPGAAIPVSVVQDQVRGLIQVHGSEWPREVRDAGAETRLTAEAILRLRALRLIRLTSDGVVPLAASGRFCNSNAPYSAPVAEE